MLWPILVAEATHRKGLESQLREVALDELEVSGSIPSWLSGTLVRNGPARYEVGDRTLNHWFDGLAMLHAFGFQDGCVSYANRYLLTGAHEAATQRGRIEYSEFATDPCRSVFSRVQAMFSPSLDGGATPNANVNVVRLGERYLALTETPLPVAFDPRTLDTLGVARDAAAPGQHATAHPHHDPDRDELVAYVVAFGPRSRYVLYAVPADGGERRPIASLPVSRPSYMHSFALTPRYAVLCEFPLVVNPLRLASRARPFIENYRWDPDRPARFLVVDRQAGELRGAYETDPFFCFHHINAFERGGTLVIDLSAYDDDEIIRALYLDRARDPETVFPTAAPRRYEIDLDGGGVRSRSLADIMFELPRIDYRRHNGRDYRYAYATSLREPGAPGFLDQLAKLDVADGSVATWHEEGCFPGEPVFVAAPGVEGEDDGVLLSVVLDARSGTSFLLALDAGDLHELGRAHVPQHVPFGFHGSYFRSAQKILLEKFLVTTPGAILDAALHAFDEKGQATIDDVRERSGASVGSIYHHFGGKEQLAAALYVRALADYQDGFLAALRRHRTARAGVRGAVEHHVAWVTARPELARYLLGRSAAEVERASGGALRERNRAFFAAVQAWLAPHVEGGVLADLPLDVCSALWIGAAQEWSRQWLEGRVETPPRRAARLLADAAWQALKTKEDR